MPKPKPKSMQAKHMVIEPRPKPKPKATQAKHMVIKTS